MFLIFSFSEALVKSSTAWNMARKPKQLKQSENQHPDILEYHDILRHFGIYLMDLWSRDPWAEILAFRKWPASEMQGVKPTNPSSTSSIKLYDP